MPQVDIIGQTTCAVLPQFATAESQLVRAIETIDSDTPANGYTDWNGVPYTDWNGVFYTDWT